MKLLLKLADETLGFAETAEALTDPPMGCGDVAFQPLDAYSTVESLFRSRSVCIGGLGDQGTESLETIDRKLSEFNLVLVAETGEPLDIMGFSIQDFRPEFPEEGLHLEFVGMHQEQFGRLFPGHYAKYEAACASKA
ncbi:hypothetical protein [Roseateles sp.]|jgi:hypothetical protein|uniref:hypothetical protein n=1 Tax=Roseateles sp. TaxID=1971397 RepID=UPI003D13DB22